MEIQGKIIAVLPEKSGTSARGGWKSQQYVLETEEQYPKRCLFDVFGEDKIKQYALQEQMRVKVSYDPRADETRSCCNYISSFSSLRESAVLSCHWQAGCGFETEETG